MKGSVIALVAALALFALVSPTMAVNEAVCSNMNQVGGNLPGAGGSVAGGFNTQFCGSAGPSGNAPSGATVTASEPILVLAVGLGLLSARLLRRR